MGNTTIIELNHDRYDEIEKDPAKWVESLLRHMRLHAGSESVRIPGGEITATFHRGDTDDYFDWIKFRERIKHRHDEWAKKYGGDRKWDEGQAVEVRGRDGLGIVVDAYFDIVRVRWPDGVESEYFDYLVQVPEKVS